MRDRVICDKYVNIPKLINRDCVDLSIVVPPYGIRGSRQAFFREVLECMAAVTKPGGMCCMLVSDEIVPKTDLMSMESTKSILQVIDSQKDWMPIDKIIWVKSREILNENEPLPDSPISFEDTPFVAIHVLVKKGSIFEPIDFREKSQTLSFVTQTEKDKWSEDIWHIHPSSEKGYKDMIPAELVTRLILLFSDEKQLVLDPFCGHGIIGKVATSVNRHFICIGRDKTNCKIASQRIQKSAFTAS